MIGVVHAYSRANEGDGLLVDLTMSRLRETGIPASECILFALDPESFRDTARVMAVGTPGRAISLDTAAGSLRGLALLGSRPDSVMSTRTGRALAGCDGFVAVGGGYLRAGTPVNAAGSLVNHLPQLAAVTRSGRPAIYLPQSVGPLSGPVGRRLKRHLRDVASVHLRDDRSLAELDGAGNAHRTPDLAVLELVRRPRADRTTVHGSPIVIARRLPRAFTYPDRLVELASQLGNVRWAVQAEGDPSKSDQVFYTDTLHVDPAGSPSQLCRDDPGPVVSVRLHGALGALLDGVPAIHLGYERKSWGAYEDLGLAQWLHDARSFEPTRVARQVRELAEDPRPYWAALDTALPDIDRASRGLTSEMRSLLA